jgi:glycosyltransferase involved in cell wall biosynthesis
VKVLLVVPQPPAAQGGAAARCTIGLVRGLAANGVDVHVLAAHVDHTPAYDVADVGAPLEIVEVATARGWRGRVASVVDPVGALAAGSAFAARVGELAGGVDVVHLEQVETARAYASPATVAHLHYRAALDRPFGPPWRRQFRQVLEFTRAERSAARTHRWLVANSPRVASSLRRLAPGADVTVVPLTLDASAYVPAPPPPTDPPAAGLIGSGAWPPTAAAFERLARRVWPIVAAAVPEARLALAGRGTPYGEVDDATRFLQRLHVLVNPVERGSGMKVKTLEALALGVPVVTTPEGAEGVPPSDGVLVATGDAALAAHTIRLLTDAAERAERAAAARRTFDEHLSPPVAGASLAALYERMLTSGGSAPRRR